MRYLKTLTFSERIYPRTHLYPYNILQERAGETLVFDSITLLHGSNGSGKSTVLNLLAGKLKATGFEAPKRFGQEDYFINYLNESILTFEVNEETEQINRPQQIHYLKSEDILYEMKKIQQEAVLQEGYEYQQARLGRPKHKRAMAKEIDKIVFSQEKYSNGELAWQVYQDVIQMKGLYLLDEPEVSLSLERQLELIDLISEMTRFFDCQFIIATHSPLLLRGLEGKIYDFDSVLITEKKWRELDIIKKYKAYLK